MFYMTPNLLQAFDISCISNTKVLTKYVHFQNLQLGMHLVSNKPLDDLHSSTSWQANLRFICDYMACSEYVHTFQAIGKSSRGLQKRCLACKTNDQCKAEVLFKRCDPDDVKSCYILVRFNPFHNHKLKFT